MSRVAMHGTIWGVTCAAPVKVARVLADTFQASTGRWVHWVRLEFTDPSHAHYSSSAFRSFADVLDWVEWYCCASTARHGCVSLRVDWEGDPALEVVA